MNEQTIFTDALARKNPDERQAFLNEACGNDQALRAQVEELLAAGEGAGSFLEHPPVGLDATVDASLSGKDTVDNELSGALPPLEPCDNPDRIGKLGVYEIIEVVGQGGMGTVLRAFDTKLSRIVALKVMASELAANPTAVKRFLREARSAAAVVHDHVVTIHAIDDQSRLPYLVMEFIQGQTLQQKIDREGALELKQILRIGSQMAAGLAAAHKTGLIHRDVKPANILLENGVERVKITDFGLARAADDVEMTKTGMIAGTPQYMSPEQATGDAIDSRSDLFSLGSVLYTMCAGRPAFRAETTMGTLRRVCDDAPRPIHEVNAEIPPWLEAIVNKLLAKNPADRFQTAAEVADLLHQFLAHLQQPGTMPLPAAPVLVMSAVPVHVAGRHGETSPAALGMGIMAILCIILLAVPTLGMVILGLGWFLYASGSESKMTVVTRPIQVDHSSDKTGYSLLLPVAPFDATVAKFHQESWAGQLGVDVELTNSLGMKLRLIPPGEFMMGTASQTLDQLVERLSSEERLERVDKLKYEKLPRKVRLREPFYLSSCEVTVGQFRRFIEATGYQTDGEKSGDGGWSGRDGQWMRHKEHIWKTPGAWSLADDQPVVHVSFRDALAFCDWLSKEEGKQYSLPTEVQWEFAARAGTTSLFGETDDPQALAAYAWYKNSLPDNRRNQPQAVGGRAANAFGLYDMLGNVWEWTSTWHPVVSDRRILRGGSWYSQALMTRPAMRSDGVLPHVAMDAGTGFRVAIVVDADPAAIQARNSAAQKFAGEAAGWTPLFNGKDLTGWQALPAETQGWQVENGVLVGNAERSVLQSKRDDYQDFHLRASVKINPGGDSGLYFRCRPDESLPRFFRTGYEAQIIAPSPQPSRTGTLYKFKDGQTLDLKLVDANLIQADTWFELEVIAVGNRITVKVEGQTTAEYVDEQPSEVRGHIAMDTYKEGTRVQFRKIEIQELPPGSDGASSGGTALPPAAVAPFGPKQAREHQMRWAGHLGIAAEETNALGMKFQLIPPGEFERGSTDKELERWREAGREQYLNQFFFNILASEGPQHHVVMSKPLYMAATEVSRGEFRKVVEAKGYKTAAETDGKGGGVYEKGVLVNRTELNWKNPGIKQNEDTHPVTQVTWDDALAFCQWLSEKEGRICRLPTEAEWEYACRAGTTTSFHGGDTLRLQDVDDPRYIGGTNPVELLAPNPFGLFGMHTNVIEWCSDFWDQSTYSRLPTRIVDPVGPQEGTKRVQRDGAWGDLDCQRRSATRRGAGPNERHAGLGFRVVMEVKLRPKEWP